MGPLMKEAMRKGKSHADAHGYAIRKIAADWKKYKAKHYPAVKAKRRKKKVKKTKRRSVCRRRNPASSVRTKVAQAADLYQRFSGEQARYLDTVEVPRDKVLMQIGRCDGVLYSARRDGSIQKYVHEFTGHSRPLLCASHDGKQLYLIGGKYDFTEDGIVDKK